MREGRYFLHIRTPQKAREQPTVADFMNRFPGMFQTVTDRDLFGMNTLTKMVDEIMLHRTSTARHREACGKWPNDYEINVPAITVGPVAAAKDQPQQRPLLPKLDILAVDPDEELQEEWEAEDDAKGGPLDPHEVKNACEKETKYLWNMEVYEYSTEPEARARTGRKSVGLKWIDTNKGSAEAPRNRSRLVCTEVRHKGVEPIFSATTPLETLRVLISVACQEDVFRVEDPFPDHHR